MNDKIIWYLAVIALLLIMLYCNRKVRLFALIKEQFLVFKNDKKKKISVWDLICFFVFPIAVSCILVFALEFIIKDSLANLLTTVFSIIFTVLFIVENLLISKQN